MGIGGVITAALLIGFVAIGLNRARAVSGRAECMNNLRQIGIATHTLNDGTKIPAIGLGTWPMDDATAEEAVAGALRMGYRLVDTATNTTPRYWAALGWTP